MLELGIVAVVSALAWVYLVVAHGGYWRTDQLLPGEAALGDGGAAGDRGDGAGETTRRWPSVVAVVPARNEAGILPVTMPTLLAQQYPGEFSVTLVDDGSTDGTADEAAKLTGLNVVASKPTEPGWAGKVWAMAQGLDNAPVSTYVLFTDADIAWRPGTLAGLVAAAQAAGSDLLSQMALLRAKTPWEKVIVPAFVYFFAQLYPFRKVNKNKIAAAAGGCMLVRREALTAAGGLASISGALIDDVALGKAIKRAGGRCWLGLTKDVTSARPYPRLADLWQMIARSAYTQLRYSPALLAGTIAGLTVLYAVPPAAAIAGVAAGAPLAAAAGLAGWALMTASFVPMLRFYGLSPLRAVTLPCIALLYAAMTADSARRHYAGRAVSWRGRQAERVRSELCARISHGSPCGPGLGRFPPL